MKGNLSVCRSCGSRNFDVFLDLGSMPLADRMLKPAQLEEAEPFFPLEVAFCHDCALVQITETVAPRSSSTPTIRTSPRSRITYCSIRARMRRT